MPVRSLSGTHNPLLQNYLNSVERGSLIFLSSFSIFDSLTLNLESLVVQYSNSELMEQEAAHEISESKPRPEWPETGAIEFKDLEMRYRPGLPNVLHGISMSIRGGEKIGIVGRTGAGKSSITLALLRIVEYSGSIIIDG
jgi:ATP-binding cassette subfamily C (CFTR/MRP) protein 1